MFIDNDGKNDKRIKRGGWSWLYLFFYKEEFCLNI